MTSWSGQGQEGGLQGGKEEGGKPVALRSTSSSRGKKEPFPLPSKEESPFTLSLEQGWEKDSKKGVTGGKKGDPCLSSLKVPPIEGIAKLREPRKGRKREVKPRPTSDQRKKREFPLSF